MSRDVPGMERSLLSHRVEGYPVEVPIFGQGTAQSSTRILGRVSYRVRPERPIKFDELAQQLRWSSQKRDLDGWRTELTERGHREPMTMIPPEIQDILEEGGSASWRDVHEMWLMRGGCLDMDGNVTCFDFDSTNVTVPAERVRPGLLLEFYDEKLKRWGWPGRVVEVERTPEGQTVYLELFEPVPFMDAPEAWEPWKIRPGFYAPITYKLGYGTYEAWEKSGMPALPGEPQPDPEHKRKRPHFLLREPMPLSVVEDFCRERFPDQPECVRQAMLMYILPLQSKELWVDSGGKRVQFHQGGRFRPIPEDLARAGEIAVVDPETFTGL